MHVNFPRRPVVEPLTVTSPAAGGSGDGELSWAPISKASTLSEQETLELVRACSWTLVRVGSNWEVWEVHVFECVSSFAVC